MEAKQLFLQDRDVALRYGVSRLTIWKWLRDNSFPQPIKLSPGCTRWRLTDLEAWELKIGGVGEWLASSWRKVEDDPPPKDGKPILVREDDDESYGSPFISAWFCGKGWLYEEYIDVYTEPYSIPKYSKEPPFTHWMPIPGVEE